MTHDRSSPSADEDGSIAAILPDRQGEINLAIATDRSVVEGSRIPEGVSELIANPSSFMVAGPRFEPGTDSLNECLSRPDLWITAPKVKSSQDALRQVLDD